MTAECLEIEKLSYTTFEESRQPTQLRLLLKKLIHEHPFTDTMGPLVLPGPPRSSTIVVWTQAEKMASLVDSITLRKKGGWTLLHGFAATGNEIGVRMLLDKGESNLVNVIESKCGLSPLHVAALHGHDVVVQTLLEYGAQVGINDQWYKTLRMLGTPGITHLRTFAPGIKNYIGS